jgi:hypothetical protein
VLIDCYECLEFTDTKPFLQLFPSGRLPCGDANADIG